MSPQRPGIHPNLEFRSLDITEEKIIKHFSSIWFITFLKRQTFKSSDYTFAFAHPSDHLTERYHFEREILILLTPYENFDTRSLDFVDKIIFEYQNRLDKLLVFLVSRDVEIEEKIRSVVLQDQESRIFIPFSYEEFNCNTSKADLIEEKIKKFFFTRDLFSFNSPSWS